MKKVIVGFLTLYLGVSAHGNYTPLSYLEATGSQWIHTGYTPNATDRVETRVRFSEVAGTYAVWCTRAGGGSDSFTCMFFGNGRYQVKHGNNGDAEKSTASGIVGLNEDAFVVANGATGKCSCNYQDRFTVSTVDFRPAGPLALLALHECGEDLAPDSTMKCFMKGRLYYFRVYDKNGKLVRDFIPVRDDDAEEGATTRYGLFETVTGVFHPNCGSQSFTPGPVAGPEPHRMQREIVAGGAALENGMAQVSLAFANPGYPQRLFMAWGDSDGGNVTNGWEHVEVLDDVGAWEMSRDVQLPNEAKCVRFFVQPAIPGAKMLDSLSSSGNGEFVNADFKASQASCAECRFKLRSKPGSGYVCPFGSRTSNTPDQFYGFADKTQWYFRYGNSGSTIAMPTVVREYHFLLDRSFYVADGTLYSMGTKTFNAEYDLYVFALNNIGAAQWFAPMDLYSLSLWDDGEFKRSYVPCVKDDGTPALYDTVRGDFAVNEGAGTLGCGTEVWSVSDVLLADLTLPATAEWSGRGTTDAFDDRGNWICKNINGDELPNALPRENTVVTVKGTTTFNWPGGRVLVCKSIAFDCVLAADADWRGLDSSRVVPGAKIDLDGHKLQVADLAFDGTITGKADLTEPVAARVSSSSTFLTPAANVFNDNFVWNADPYTRTMVAQANLPMELIYDFGEGEAKAVNCYRLFGNGQGDKNRMPRSWTMQGSNDRTTWTLLDTHADEIGWSPDDDVRVYSFANTTPYRYYRLYFTATQTTDANYLSLTQLEFFDGPISVSELHVMVPEGVTAVNSTVKLSGSLKLVKEGAGTLCMAMERQYYTGGTEVEEGTLQAGVDGIFAYGYGVIRISSDGCFDTNAYPDIYRVHFILDGGTLVNTASGVSVTKNTIGWVTLTRNSSVRPYRGMGGWTQADQGGGVFLNLNTFTLDVAADAGNIQFRGGGTITNGTILVHGGLTTYGEEIEASTVDFEFFKDLSLYGNIAMRDLTLHDTIESINPITGTVMVKGTFTPETTKIPKVELRDGSTFNLKSATEAWPTTGDIAGGMISFAENADVTLDLGMRPLRNRPKVLTWETGKAPANIDTVHFYVKGRNYGTTVGTDGLYLYSTGLTILVR